MVSATIPFPNALLVAFFGLATYIFLGAIYRLFFHPLRKIPGPKLAALTWWYEIYYDVIQPGQYNFKLLDLHKRYGPILRVNPDEVHIADKEYLGELYDARKRNKLHEHSLDIEYAVAGTADYELHRKRRQSMIAFFSPSAVRQLEPMLARKRDIFQCMIREGLSSENKVTPINLSDMYFAYCWDLIQEYAFAFESNVLSNPEESHKLRVNSNDLMLQVNFTRHFGWINALASHLPAVISEKLTPPGVKDLKAIAMRVRATVEDVLRDDKTTKEDIENSTQHRSIFYTLRDDPSLPEEEKTPIRLEKEGNFLVVAASESPAKALAITHFHLLNNKEYLTKLRQELKPLGPNPEIKALERLPYLHACITEGTRLSFGLSRRMLRVAPEDTLVYKGYAIPPGTPVATSSLAIHTDESIYPDPFAFIPDRWLGPGAKDLRKYHMSFGAKSPRSCLGVYLAETEMKLAIAAACRFEMDLFETTIKDVEYKHDFQVPIADLRSKGVRAIVGGEME